MGGIILKGYVCERCDHKWAPRENIAARPKVCPKCKSAYWDSPRILPGKKIARYGFQHKRKLV